MRNLSWLGLVLVGALVGCLGSEEPETKAADPAQAETDEGTSSNSAGGAVKVVVDVNAVGTKNGSDKGSTGGRPQ